MTVGHQRQRHRFKKNRENNILTNEPVQELFYSLDDPVQLHRPGVQNLLSAKAEEAVRKVRGPF